MTTRRAWMLIGPVAGWLGLVGADPARGNEPAAPAGVSFDRQVRPILRDRCQGCHQPARPGGKYVLTDRARLVAGGESGPAVVAGDPGAGSLVEQVTPGADGKAAMPQGAPPLAPAEVDLIRRWIAEGAVDDSPPAARDPVDRDHPPAYDRPPVITALDYSPDGRTLAVGGFHEVVLWKADGSELLARLVGLAERVEAARFSPDGRRLAVAGGLPARAGEVQVWDVEERRLDLSTAVTFDTIRGLSWSPDGSKVAFGGADNSVRAIDAKTGAQALFMGSHADWALGTAFVGDGHLVSVGRDGAAKLTELATQRFVDNVTSITPGALKGGLAATVAHPGRPEVLFGGADGVPRLYRVFRETERVIGDDANLIGAFEAIPGRIFALALGAEGRVFAAAGGLDRRGRVDIYADAFDPAAAPEAIRATLAKAGRARTPEERGALDKYRREHIRRTAAVDLPGVAYAVAVRPDGKSVATAGSDGTVRLIEPETGRVAREFCPVPLGSSGTATADPGPVADAAPTPEAAPSAATESDPGPVAALAVQPSSITLDGRADRVQLVVTATGPDGATADATRAVTVEGADGVVRITRSGAVEPVRDGAATLQVSLGGRSVAVPVRVAGLDAPARGNFARDVAPVLSKLGCNAGTCHGSAQGKNGFKLSLRGYDPTFDVRALADDLGARRVNSAAPDNSLFLLKATGAVPHGGGSLVRRGDAAYATLRAWVAGGARLDPAPKVAKIDVSPVDPVIRRAGDRQQLRVVATYDDGSTRDVTSLAIAESGNIEVAAVDKSGLMTGLRRGEAPALVRFEGAYAATTLTVMGDRAGFAWEDPPAYNRVDELVAAKWKRLKIRPSGLATDAEFLRRARLDLTGLPPTADEVRAFLADPAESRAKREALVDRLIGSPEFVEHWANKWADLLLVNRKFLGAEGAVAFRAWIKDQVAANTPYDRFARDLLSAAGSNRTNPPASYHKILREPTALMENTTQLFLGVRFNCNKCHDHPFERWTQDQYYELAASFARVGLKADPESKDRKIGGSAVEAAQPLYEEVYDRADGEVTHDRTKQVAPPRFPFACPDAAPPADPGNRRAALAGWITAPGNPYFARSHVNRLWGYVMGVGIIEPVDDIRAGNPPSNPELLDYLTREFVAHGFDSRHVLRLICHSRTYQLSVATNEWNADDKANFAHATARRLPAEVLLDAVHRATGSASRFPGLPPGTRAAALPDSASEAAGGFLATFGRPARETACECERSAGLQLGPGMALLGGPALGEAIADPEGGLARLVAGEPVDAKLVEELFLRILNRPATPEEVATCLGDLPEIDRDGRDLAEAAAARAAEVARELPAKESARAAAIAAARSAFEDHERAHAEEVAAAGRARSEAIARAEADLKSYEAGEPDRLAAWARAQDPIDRWRVLTPAAVSDTNKATFATRPDGSVVASGSDAAGVLTFRAEVDLDRLTGLRLEVLPDPSLPHQGPGRADDGNFVLNELRVTVAPRSDPQAARPVHLVRPLADFSQASYDVQFAVDGDDRAEKGWAVAPRFGQAHWATFDLDAPAEHPGGLVVTATMSHRFGGKSFMPGRFRLAATAVPGPAGLSLAGDLQSAAATDPAVWTAAQRAVVVARVRAEDAQLAAKSMTLANARKPLPEDPTRKDLRDRLAEAERPIPPDARLAQLERDAAAARQQVDARRLTAAQDIAWALINSPGFLFNH